ncbi:MAG: PQQ-dependent sugar dehydrogenase [Akkermansiaceae bacterium]|nr:PQQ-dependent sugar dehydrogenase [Akkermansiaceae bacterium]
MKGYRAALLTLMLFTHAGGQLVRVPNTTLNLPAALPSATGYTTQNALGDLVFDEPMSVVSVRHERHRLFVAERGGILRIVDLTAAELEAKPYLDLRDLLETDETFNRGGENGFLSVAFHPEFAANGTLFVYFSFVAKDGKLFQRLHRVVMESPASDAPEIFSHERLLTIYDRASNHNGGTIDFGPDGYLYLSLGDEGGGGDQYNNARFITQDPTAGRTGFWGQMVRLDVDHRAGNLTPQLHQQNSTSYPSAVNDAAYKVPADNPFIGRTTWHNVAINPANVRNEIWATGLRNPFRWSFDRPTGRLYLGDVGQGAREEIDIITRGGDYGWSWREGTREYNSPPSPEDPPPSGFSPIEPIYDYGRSSNGVLGGNCVTGGAVYRGNRLTELFGAYVFADYSGPIVALRENNGTWTAEKLGEEGGIVHFGHDPRDGDLLFCANGQVKRFVRSQTTGTAPPATLSAVGAFSNLASLTPHAGIVPYDVNLPFWSDHAIKRRWFSIRNTTDDVTYSRDGNWTLPTGMVWVKHFDIETVRGQPSSARKLETRILVKTASGTYGLSYRWRADQTDADLVDEEGRDDPLTITVGGSPTSQTWRFPSRGQCMNCHTPVGGHALSFNTRQLNRDHLYGTQTRNQLTALEVAGYFSNSVGGVHTLPAYAATDDATQSREWRVRSYLAVNCSQCHQPGGPASGNWDARATVETDAAMIINGVLLDPAGNAANRFVVPGDVTHSVAVRRMQGIPSRMPPIGSNVIDSSGVALLTDWINADLPARRSFAQWQVAMFGDPPPARAAPDQDPDGDGLDNRTEYLAGTLPETANPPSLLKADISGGQLRFRHTLPANRAMVIETSETLAPGSWVPWDVPGNSPVFPAAAGERTLEIPLPTGPRRFFRGRISAP